MRIDPATVGWALGQPARDGEMRAWIRFADGREPDALSLPFFLDAMPPVTFTFGALGWAPTIAFSGHVRSRPAPGWLRMRITTRNVIGGLFEEDAVIWDSRDRVVAQSRQARRRPYAVCRRCCAAARRRCAVARRRYAGRPRERLRPPAVPQTPSEVTSAVTALASLPGVADKVDAAREACTQAPMAQRPAPPHPRGRGRVAGPRRPRQR